jgi:phage terminase Nu1 subunit (DNA packaging protein)
MSELAQVIDFASARAQRTAQRNEPWVSKARVAEHMGVSTRTVTRWMYERSMPFDPGPWRGAHPRFRLSEVEAWRCGR